MNMINIINHGHPSYSPPVTDKYLLVKYCSIRTEERHRIESILVKRVTQTDMVCLAVLLRVSIVTSIY